MKKLVCLLLAVLLVLGACACAAKDQTTASDTTDQPAAQEPADTADNADETATSQQVVGLLTRSANTTPRLKLPQP